MTHYELQVARNKKYADRTKVLIQTPVFLMFVIDDEYCHSMRFDKNGKCIEAHWDIIKDKRV